MDNNFHLAVQRNLAHGAMACEDMGTESLVAQCTQPADLHDWAEGEHPAQRQADAETELPAWWPWAAAAVLGLTLACSAFWPWGFAS